VIIGVLRWGWVEVFLRVSLEVILYHLLRQLGSHSPGEGGRQRLSEAVEHASSWTTGIIYTPEGWCIHLVAVRVVLAI